MDILTPKKKSWETNVIIVNFFGSTFVSYPDQNLLWMKILFNFLYFYCIWRSCIRNNSSIIPGLLTTIITASGLNETSAGTNGLNISKFRCSRDSRSSPSFCRTPAVMMITRELAVTFGSESNEFVEVTERSIQERHVCCKCSVFSVVKRKTTMESQSELYAKTKFLISIFL